MMETGNFKSTKCVHAGKSPDSDGVVGHIQPSTAYRYLESGSQPYPRYFNTPNQQNLVEKICQLENAEDGLVFSSGMAAITTTLSSMLSRGDHIVLQRAIYGGTHTYVIEEFERVGIEFTFVDCDLAEVAKAIRPETRVVYAETPANPLLQIMDLAGVAKIAAEKNIISVVDNTFASPINQNPIDLGIDVVVHSGTKYLGGHSDLSFGTAVSDRDNVDRIRQKAVLYGGSLNPLSIYLAERSIKTLAVRVERQNQNAMSLANFLDQHSAVEAVYYPGLAGHVAHDVAAEQMQGFGGMLSFSLRSELSSLKLLQNLKLIEAAMSLGGVETTATLPATTSHKTMPQEEREQQGITDQLVRLSVGIESSEDLIRDLDQAIKELASH